MGGRVTMGLEKQMGKEWCRDLHIREEVETNDQRSIVGRGSSF